MYNIYICDDNINDIRQMEDVIRECTTDTEILSFREYTSGEALLAHLSNDCDAIFLDIQLSAHQNNHRIDGSKTAALLRRRNYNGLLIFCANTVPPTPEIIKFSPFRYLFKNSPHATLCQEIFEILKEIDRKKSCRVLYASYQRERVLIQTADIRYITHHGKKSQLHLALEKSKQYTEDPLLVSETFANLIECLRPMGFVYPHNSYLVNLHYVTQLNTKEEVFLLDTLRIPIARGKLRQIKKEYLLFRQ